MLFEFSSKSALKKLSRLVIAFEKCNSIELFASIIKESLFWNNEFWLFIK